MRARFELHADQLGPATWSPDGRHLTTVTSDGRVALWSAENGETLRLITQHATTPRHNTVTAASFTPDGSGLVTAGQDGTVAIWDVATGARRLSIDAGGHPFSAVVGPDGTIAAGLADGAIQLWDATGTALGALHGHAAVAALLAFDRGGQLISGGEDDTTRIWDVAARAPIAVLRGRNFALDPTAPRIATAGGDDVVRIWSTHDGKLLLDLIGHRGALASVRFRADGTEIVTTGRDGTFRRWDAASGAPRAVFDAAPGAAASVHLRPGAFDAAFSPDGSRLVMLDSRELKLWRVDDAPLIVELGAADAWHAAAFSPDGRTLASGGAGGQVTLWQDGRVAGRFQVGGTAIECVAWSPDSTSLVVTGWPDVAQVFAADGTPGPVLAGHRKAVLGCAWSPDGASVATASNDATLRLWDAATGAERRVIDHPQAVTAVAWSRDGSRLATAGWDHHLRVWDARTGALRNSLDGGTLYYRDVDISPDGRSLAAIGKTNELELWDIATGTRRALELHPAIGTSVAWSPDGAMIASGSNDRFVRIWDAATGAALAVRPHPGQVRAVAWSPDGTRLVSAAEDNGLRVWDVRADTRAPSDITALVKALAPYRLVGGRLEHAR